MSSSIPQFDSSFFQSQLFWLGVTYLIFLLVISRIVIPRIQSVQKRRDEIVDSANKEIENIEKAGEELLKKQNQQLEISREEAYRLVSSARSSLKDEAESAYKEIAKEFEQESIVIENKLHALFQEQLMKNNDNAYVMASIILQEIHPDIEQNAELLKKKFSNNNN